MDLRMPGMDGLEAIRRIRARPDEKAELPIIVITADTAIDLRERCLEAGADDVLFKPVAMDALFDSIGRVLAIRGGGGMILSGVREKGDCPSFVASQSSRIRLCLRVSRMRR